MKPWAILFLLLFLPLRAFGASELSGFLLFVQVFNFSLFFLAGFFLLKNPIQALFHKRQKDFVDWEKKGKQLEQEKQAENQALKKRLEQQEEKEKNIEDQAHKQAQKFQDQKQQELKELQQTLKKSSDFLIRLESEKSKKESLIYWQKSLVEKSKKELLVQSQQSPPVQKQNLQDQASQDFLKLLKESS